MIVANALEAEENYGSIIDLLFQCFFFNDFVCYLHLDVKNYSSCAIELFLHLLANNAPANKRKGHSSVVRTKPLLWQVFKVIFNNVRNNYCLHIFIISSHFYIGNDYARGRC